MLSQSERARLFHGLHIKGNPLTLFNIWDAGSAKAIAEIGAKAIATGSWSVAAAHGYEDKEKLPLELVLHNLEQIVASVDLPVTLDLESGYARSPEKLREVMAKVIAAGAAGINFEDQIIGAQGLYSMEEQGERIRALRDEAESGSVPIFINARTDIFLKIDPTQHDENHLDEALQRAEVYAKSGASGFFTPGLRNPELIEKLCESSPLPVNILMFPDAPPAKQLAQLGVARISHGPWPYRQMIQALKEAGRKAFALD